MQTLNKPVLTFDEFTELLNNSDKKYNLDSDGDFIKVKSILLDFIREGRIRPTFNYAGMYTSKASDHRDKTDEPVCNENTKGNLYIFASSLATLIEQQNSYLQVSNKENIKDQIFNDWLHIPEYMADRIISKNLAHFNNMLEKDALFKRIELHDEKLVGFHDLRYPRVDINKIFNEDRKTDYKQTIARLESELAQANIELNTLKNQTDMLTDNDNELSHNSEAKVAKLIYILLSELKYELTLGGKGNSNLLIENASKNLENSLSPNFIAKWLKKAYQLQIKDIKE